MATLNHIYLAATSNATSAYAYPVVQGSYRRDPVGPRGLAFDVNGVPDQVEGLAKYWEHTMALMVHVTPRSAIYGTPAQFEALFDLRQPVYFRAPESRDAPALAHLAIDFLPSLQTPLTYGADSYYLVPLTLLQKAT